MNASSPPSSDRPQCRIIRPNSTYDGKQGFSYFEGIARETVGASGICMHLLTIPPGGRAKAHLHESHETAIFVVSGVSGTWWGERLEHHETVAAGDLFYIPAGVPHLPYNAGTEPCVASSPAPTRTNRKVSSCVRTWKRSCRGDCRAANADIVIAFVTQAKRNRHRRFKEGP